MPSTYIAIHLHVVFSTKNREPAIHADWRDRLHEYLGGTLRGMDATALAIGGVADHVHLLVSLKGDQAVADLVRELKKASTVWVRDETDATAFHWQEGYAAISVSPGNLEAVRRYIAKQEEHHRKVGFREELVAFLKRAGVPYDPAYLD